MLGKSKLCCASSAYGKVFLRIAMGPLIVKTRSVDGVLLLAYKNINNLKNP